MLFPLFFVCVYLFCFLFLPEEYLWSGMVNLSEALLTQTQRVKRARVRQEDLSLLPAAHVKGSWPKPTVRRVFLHILRPDWESSLEEAMKGRRVQPRP